MKRLHLRQESLNTTPIVLRIVIRFLEGRFDMFARYFMIFSLLLFVAACSGNTDKGGIETTVDGGPPVIQQDDLYSADTDGPAPGTQADLVVNVGDRVFFDTDSSDLSAPARETLANQSSWLGQYPNLTVTVEGHADERGTREYNLALGERRANAVRNYLIALGIDAGRIDVISYGKERPAVPGYDESSWSQNRRGVTKVR